MDDEKKTIKTKSFTLGNVNHLIIGDPLYFEAIASHTDNGAEKELVYKKPVKDIVYGEMDVSLSEVKYLSYDEKLRTYEMIDVNIYLSGSNFQNCSKEENSKIVKAYFDKNSKMPKESRDFIEDLVKKNIETMRNNRYYTANGKPKTRTLACDSAQFDITVNKKRFEEFKTGADGYYGEVIEYGKNAGIQINLSFDDTFDFDTVIRQLSYLFEAKEIEKDKDIEKEIEDDLER